MTASLVHLLGQSASTGDTDWSQIVGAIVAIATLVGAAFGGKSIWDRKVSQAAATESLASAGKNDAEAEVALSAQAINQATWMAQRLDELQAEIALLNQQKPAVFGLVTAVEGFITEQVDRWSELNEQQMRRLEEDLAQRRKDSDGLRQLRVDFQDRAMMLRSEMLAMNGDGHDDS